MVVAGEVAGPGDTRRGFVAYVTPAGELDPTFGGGAVKVWPIADRGGLGGVALQGDGKIVAAGWSQVTGEQEKLTVVRLNRNGSLGLDVRRRRRSSAPRNWFARRPRTATRRA